MNIWLILWMRVWNGSLYMSRSLLFYFLLNISKFTLYSKVVCKRNVVLFQDSPVISIDQKCSMTKVSADLWKVFTFLVILHRIIVRMAFSVLMLPIFYTNIVSLWQDIWTSSRKAAGWKTAEAALEGTLNYRKVWIFLDLNTQYCCDTSLNHSHLI